MSISFTEETIVFIPFYNCEDTINELIESIPVGLLDNLEFVLIDNCSTDRSLSRAIKSCQNCLKDFRCTILKINKNVGYAGTQKLMYSIARSDSNVKNVVMLHGDGQYPAALLDNFLSHQNDGYAIVYGYRHNDLYRHLDETPWLTSMTIKLLSCIESFFTRQIIREWHSGYYMISTDFLRSVDLTKLTSTPHIDGNLLFIASSSDLKILPVPIYKKYVNLDAFEGLGRIKYVLTVIGLTFKFALSRPSQTTLDSTTVNLLDHCTIQYRK